MLRTVPPVSITEPLQSVGSASVTPSNTRNVTDSGIASGWVRGVPPCDCKRQAPYPPSVTTIARVGPGQYARLIAICLA